MSPFSWLPDWVFLGLFVVGALFGLALLFMPFSVFGIKPRLGEVELQLAELRAEVRALSLRLAIRTNGDGGGMAEDVAAIGPEFSAASPLRPERSQAAPLRTTQGYMAPASTVPRHETVYEDSPVPQDPEQFLRPTRFEPPVTQRAQPRLQDRGWARAPWENGRQGASAREGLSPREGDPERRSVRTSRSEPTLRWPPRGE